MAKRAFLMVARLVLRVIYDYGEENTNLTNKINTNSTILRHIS